MTRANARVWVRVGTPTGGAQRINQITSHTISHTRTGTLQTAEAAASRAARRTAAPQARGARDGEPAHERAEAPANASDGESGHLQGRFWRGENR